MAGERKGEMLQDVKKECHRAKEELQDQLTASEGENNAARRRLLAYRAVLGSRVSTLCISMRWRRKRLHLATRAIPVSEQRCRRKRVTDFGFSRHV